MCKQIEMTPKQLKATLQCSCKAPKRFLKLYSCCGFVNVVCSPCDTSGVRVGDYVDGVTADTLDKTVIRPRWMDEVAGNSIQRDMAIKKWNGLRKAGVL